MALLIIFAALSPFILFGLNQSAPNIRHINFWLLMCVVLPSLVILTGAWLAVVYIAQSNLFTKIIAWILTCFLAYWAVETYSVLQPKTLQKDTVYKMVIEAYGQKPNTDNPGQVHHLLWGYVTNKCFKIPVVMIDDEVCTPYFNEKTAYDVVLVQDEDPSLGLVVQRCKK